MLCSLRDIWTVTFTRGLSVEGLLLNMYKLDVSSDSDEFDVDFGDELSNQSTKANGSCHSISVSVEQHLESDNDVLAAVRTSNVDDLRKILSKDFPVNKVLSDGWTLLMNACDNGVNDIVNVLLKFGADPNTQIDSYSALMAVCCSRSDSEERLVKCANLLIERGALVNSHDRHHMTPLMYACQHKRSKLAQLLLTKESDVNHQDIRGWTAFMYSAENGSIELMKMLLESGSDPRICTNSGETAATVVAASGCNLVSNPCLPAVGETTQNSLCGSLIGHESSIFVNDSTSCKHIKECHQYGDMEVFLLGLQLEDILPIFQQHQIDFAILLSMTDDDLKQIDISQVGVRKKILNAVLNVHKREWDMPRQNQSPGEVMSSSEVVLAMSHLSRHVKYLQGTAHLVLKGFNENQCILDSRMEQTQAERLHFELKNLEISIQALQQDIEDIKKEVNLAVRPQSTVEIEDTQRSYMTVTVASCICGIAACGVLVWFRFFR